MNISVKRRKLISKGDRECYYCGTEMDTSNGNKMNEVRKNFATVEHINRRSETLHPNCDSNLVLVCLQCNRIKDHNDTILIPSYKNKDYHLRASSKRFDKFLSYLSGKI